VAVEALKNWDSRRVPRGMGLGRELAPFPVMGRPVAWGLLGGMKTSNV